MEPMTSEPPAQMLPPAGAPPPAARRPEPARAGPARTAILALLPLAALAAVIVAFLNAPGGVPLSSPVPVESVAVERIVLHPGVIRLHVRNTGPQPVQIAQAIVNDAVWPFGMGAGSEGGGGGQNPVGRLQSSIVTLRYPWVEGEAYRIRLLTSNGIPIDAEIPVAVPTPPVTPRTLWGFTLIGVYVGVLPVYLGMLWYPALRRVGGTGMLLVLSVTLGLLIALGIEALAEGLKTAADVPAPLQGVALVGLGLVVTSAALDAVSRRPTSPAGGEAARRLRLAYLIALGIGIHNLGEGLAIGAAYAVGEMALGVFLVIGFIVQNITEGLGIVAPIVQDRPSAASLAAMGLVGGFPAVVGAWTGAFAFSAHLAALFFGIGAGAIFQVAWEVAKLLQTHARRAPARAPVIQASGVALGMVALYALGLLVK